MKTGSYNDNVINRAPVLLPFLDTKRRWKHTNEKKPDKLQKFALFNILNDLN